MKEVRTRADGEAMEDCYLLFATYCLLFVSCSAELLVAPRIASPGVALHKVS